MQFGATADSTSLHTKHRYNAIGNGRTSEFRTAHSQGGVQPRYTDKEYSMTPCPKTPSPSPPTRRPAPIVAPKPQRHSPKSESTLKDYQERLDTNRQAIHQLSNRLKYQTRTYAHKLTIYTRLGMEFKTCSHKQYASLFSQLVEIHSELESDYKALQHLRAKKQSIIEAQTRIAKELDEKLKSAAIHEDRLRKLNMQISHLNSKFNEECESYTDKLRFYNPNDQSSTGRRLRAKVDGLYSKLTDDSKFIHSLNQEYTEYCTPEVLRQIEHFGSRSENFKQTIQTVQELLAPQVPDPKADYPEPAPEPIALFKLSFMDRLVLFAATHKWIPEGRIKENTRNHLHAKADNMVGYVRGPVQLQITAL